MKNLRYICFVIFAVAGIFLSACSKAETAATVSLPPANAATAPSDNVAVNEAIRFLEDRVKRDPDDFIANNKLASEYLQRLRETGNVAYLDLASRAAKSSLKTLPAEQNKGGLSALIMTEFSSHDFAAARDNAKKLIELEPNKGYPFQFLCDALLELGQYDEAETAFRQMENFGGIRELTNVAIEQRLARMALLHGDNAGAKRHFSSALKIATSMLEPPKETVAWCQWQLGETAFAVGDYASAEKYYRDSLSTFPDYFRSLASLGRVRAARGELPEAIELYEKAVKILPDPNFAASLGDLYKLAGREQDAANQYALVETTGRLSTLSGVLYNRQLALFYADHDLKPDEAYQNAAKEYEQRRDIYGADAVAWTALKAGKIPEAQAAIKEALRLGTKDAKLFYHAGMIENAAGNRNEAKRLLTLALKTNPAFDPLQSVVGKNCVGDAEMKSKLSFVLTFLMAAFVVGLSAHPLGNFSVNQHSRLEVGRTQIKLREVLDMAEIPTFQESAAIDVNRDGKMSQEEIDAYSARLTPPYAANLVLTVNGELTAVRAISTKAELGIGAGDLPTLKISWDMIADLPAAAEINRVHFQNNNYTERVGWNEIVVSRTNGINVFDSTAFGNSLTDELRNYSEETVSAPLGERTAEFSFTSGAMPQNAKPLQNRDGKISTPVQKDKFAELISVPEITPMVALFGLLAAFGLGAIHAMSPGHGKTVVGAYLVGSKGTPKHAAFLGLTVTITHTLGVFAIGLITLFASNYILPERIMPFLNFVSGLLVFFIGVSLFKERLFAFLGWNKSPGQQHHHDDPDGEITHSHDGITHSHGGVEHTHAVPDKLTWRNLLALGISGGLLPCPSALVLMLSAISLGRIGYGLVLTIVFSIGLAATLTAIGLIFLYVGNALGKTSFSENRIVKAVPVFSAFVVASLGAVICYNALG